MTAGAASGHALAALAGTLLPPSADDAAIAAVAGELLVILRLHDGLSRGAVPPRSSVKARSRAIADLEAAAARVVRKYRDAPSAAACPNSLPADLGNAPARAGAGLQAPRTSAQDVIDLDQAGTLLGVGRERARQLVREHRLTSWHKLTGRHELQVYRAEVIALREQRSGNGTGGSEERPGDPGRSPGDGAPSRDRAA